MARRYTISVGFTVAVEVQNTTEYSNGNLNFFEIRMCEDGGYYFYKIRDSLEICVDYEAKGDCEKVSFK